ncbi:hypothetical protein UPYG_G00065970 [Umbra pygmaea]|uniref:Immunoglobulin V-set domain-containing protein n=1 Tax=Umbra pygmaea TaxID=75934 RepID=A0ABD0XAE4_UMBPY
MRLHDGLYHEAHHYLLFSPDSLSTLKRRFLTKTGGSSVETGIIFAPLLAGVSATFTCTSDLNDTKPNGIYLKRKWLEPEAEAMFMYSKEKPTFHKNFSGRIHVSGDPSSKLVKVTIGELKREDTDLYYCLFIYPNNVSSDLKIPGKTEFFLYVDDADVPDNKMDIGLLETCAGGSAVLPCLATYGSPSAIEGVCLKRRRGRAPIEVLHHTKHPSVFPQKRILHQGTGLGGLAYKITLTQMQPEESAFYSCELLLPGMPDNLTRLGRHAYYVSVQGDSCSCDSYAPLLYALSAAVGLLLILLVALVLGKFRGNRVKPQASIYEEMVGVQSPKKNVKAAPSYLRAPLHLEEIDASTYDHPREDTAREPL